MKLRSKLSLYTVLIIGASLFLIVLTLVTFESVIDYPKVNKVKIKHEQRKAFQFLPTVNLTLLQNLIQDKLNDDQFMNKFISSKSSHNFIYFVNAGDQQISDGAENQPIESVWNTVSNWITAREIISENAHLLKRITRLMSESRIIKSSIPPKGTQLKVMLVLEGNQLALFKPMRFTRDYVINGKPYAGADRHNGEIVAFHLSRVLNFRLAPITVGRKVHVASQLKSTASENLLATFLTTPNKTDCFFGRCLYCNPRDYVCPDSDGYLEGAVILMFPARFKLERIRNPWQRTYKDGLRSKWETDANYCQTRVLPHLSLHRVLDLVDTSIFDFLIGNADRHHYEVFRGVPESAILLIDNGKSFGNPFVDEISILAPLYQCCLLRSSTYNRLFKIERAGLSNLIDQLTKEDPLYPLLTGEHLFALDRRLKQILALIDICLDEKGKSKVLK